MYRLVLPNLPQFRVIEQSTTYEVRKLYLLDQIYYKNMHASWANFLLFVVIGSWVQRSGCIPAQYHLNAAVPVLFVLFGADTGMATVWR